MNISVVDHSDVLVLKEALSKTTPYIWGKPGVLISDLILGKLYKKGEQYHYNYYI